MKRILSLILTAVLSLWLCACGGNYSQVDLREPIPLTESGIVEKSVLEQLKTDNAIAAFTGSSGGMEYEWTVFGSDVTETRDVDLSVGLAKEGEGIKISFDEREELGFPALLSVYLNEKWSAGSATAYVGQDAVYSVSITGSKTSILNISVNKMVENCLVLPDASAVTQPTETDGNEEPPRNETQAEAETNRRDEYLSAAGTGDDRIYSDGSAVDRDKYNTDPVPEGKPMPVEPEDQEINDKKTYTCTFSIECTTILNNLKMLDPDKLELIPSNGVILAPVKVTFSEGESVFDVLQRVCKENGIHLESSWTPIYNTAYVEGIHNLYEFDCGELSGWMYHVNGWYPNYGCSRYQLANGDTVEFRYTCDLGKDVGCDWMG